MNQIQITILGISIIFLATTLGSSLVYFFKNDISQKTNTLFLGFASGIMIAASIWSLLIPALEKASDYGKFNVVPVSIGFIFGGLFLVFLDKIIPHLHISTGIEEGVNSKLKKSTKLFLAVTLHNIPEGLAVGFAYGAARLSNDASAYISALGLAIGIAIQNFPEGAAIALPMKNETKSNHKAFLYGVGSGVVEPIFAVLGYFLVAFLTYLQPWLLAFAAGAMIFVVAEDLIPDSKMDENPHLGTWALMIGFVIMMVLDVVLG